MYRRDLCWVALEADSAEQAMGVMGAALEEYGYVKPTFREALLNREAQSPTGLPLAGRKVAIPHTDPEHVIKAAIAVCTLARPVSFGEMGNPEQLLPVEIIAMLAFPDHESSQQALFDLIDRFQQASFIEGLYAAPDARALLAAVSGEEGR